MAYKKVRLGDYLLGYDEINKDGEFSEVDDLQGINNEKYFQGCQSNKNDIDLSRYRICRHGMFAYNKATSRNGEKISIAYRTDGDCLISPSYICFSIKDENVLMPEYLMLWFKRPVFDRYVRFNSWGSATEFFTWEDFQAIEFDLPPIEDQQKFVRQYKTITDRIEVLEKINKELEKLIRVILQRFNEDNGEELIETNLSEVIEAANTGGDAIQKVPIVNYNTGIKCARVSDLTNNNEFENWAYCKASKSVFENFKLTTGDILVTRTATLGVTQYISQDIQGVYNNGLIRLKANDKVEPLYLYWVMQNKDFLPYIRQVDAATSVRPNMKIEHLMAYKFSMLSKKHQVEFVRKVDPLRLQIEANKMEISRLGILMEILANSYF